jgi:tRNA wybutosine-synthesizing protein 2
MFAGIGYFTLPMARAGARVTAVERNPAAFEYLVENVVRNEVQARVETYRADCREVVDGGGSEFAFDRIVMGHYDAHEYLDAALDALAPGGTIHMHAVTPEALVPDRPVGRLREAAGERTVEVVDVGQVKGYSEGVAHVVVDAEIEW